MTKEQIRQLITMPTEEAFKDIAEWIDEVTVVIGEHGKDIKDLAYRVDGAEDRDDTPGFEDFDELESRIEDLESRIGDLDSLASLAWTEEKLEKLENIVDSQQKTIDNLVATVNSLLNAISSVNNTLTQPHQTAVHVPQNQWKWSCSGNTQSS